MMDASSSSHLPGGLNHAWDQGARGGTHFSAMVDRCSCTMAAADPAPLAAVPGPVPGVTNRKVRPAARRLLMGLSLMHLQTRPRRLRASLRPQTQPATVHPFGQMTTSQGVVHEPGEEAGQPKGGSGKQQSSGASTNFEPPPVVSMQLVLLQRAVVHIQKRGASRDHVIYAHA